MIQPHDLAKTLLTLRFSTAPTQPPAFDPTTDNRHVFRVYAEGTVDGTIEGNISAAITEVHTLPPPNHQGIAITFTIQTQDGSLEGFYTGSIHDVPAENKWVLNGYGKILNVSARYADLFLAEVFVQSEVPRADGRATGEAGIMTISPRSS